MVGAAIGEGTEPDGAWQEGTGANGVVEGGSGRPWVSARKQPQIDFRYQREKFFFFLIISYKILISKLDSQ